METTAEQDNVLRELIKVISIDKTYLDWVLELNGINAFENEESFLKAKTVLKDISTCQKKQHPTITPSKAVFLEKFLTRRMSCFVSSKGIIEEFLKKYNTKIVTK